MTAQRPLSLSFIPSQGVGHLPDPLQEVPEASRICVKLSSWPDVPPGLVVSFVQEGAGCGLMSPASRSSKQRWASTNQKQEHDTWGRLPRIGSQGGCGALLGQWGRRRGQVTIASGRRSLGRCRAQTLPRTRRWLHRKQHNVLRQEHRNCSVCAFNRQPEGSIRGRREFCQVGCCWPPACMVCTS